MVVSSVVVLHENAALDSSQRDLRPAEDVTHEKVFGRPVGGDFKPRDNVARRLFGSDLQVERLKHEALHSRRQR